MLRSSINIQPARMARIIFVTFATFAIFVDISGPFLASFLSKSGILLNSLFLSFLRYLSRAGHGCFQLERKNLVTFAIFADILGPFLASLLSKSGILSHLLFLRFVRYLLRVFLASKKNPCYFCDFCDICRHFGSLPGFFSF